MTTGTKKVGRATRGIRHTTSLKWVAVHVSVAYEDGTRNRYYSSVGVPVDVEDIHSSVVRQYTNSFYEGLYDKRQPVFNGESVEDYYVKATSIRFNGINGSVPKVKEYFR